jgi:hypothetical protein
MSCTTRDAAAQDVPWLQVRNHQMKKDLSSPWMMFSIEARYLVEIRMIEFADY